VSLFRIACKNGAVNVVKKLVEINSHFNDDPSVFDKKTFNCKHNIIRYDLLASVVSNGHCDVLKYLLSIKGVQDLLRVEYRNRHSYAIAVYPMYDLIQVAKLHNQAEIEEFLRPIVNSEKWLGIKEKAIVIGGIGVFLGIPILLNLANPCIARHPLRPCRV
jgi:hypothetical protein